jgi:hypothetical protein
MSATATAAQARRTVRHAGYGRDVDLDPNVSELEAGHTSPFQRQLATQ